MSTVPRWVTVARFALISVGVCALGYAVAGAVMSQDMRLAYLRFLALALAGHELILMPLAIALGVVIGRFVPVAVRPLTQAALFATAVILAIALPVLTGRGRSADLPSALPRDYSRGVTALLAFIWLGTLIVAAVKWHRTRTPRHDP